MKRRDFFEKSGCGLAGALLVSMGSASCRKTPDKTAPSPSAAPQTSAEQAAAEMSARRDMIKKLLTEKTGKTTQEAEAIISDLELKLDGIKAKCVCDTCPSALPEENETGFCHAFVGQSKIIKDEKGCDCGQCPVHKETGLKFGNYCTRGSELEQAAAKA